MKGLLRGNWGAQYLGLEVIDHFIACAENASPSHNDALRRLGRILISDGDYIPSKLRPFLVEALSATEINVSKARRGRRSEDVTLRNILIVQAVKSLVDIGFTVARNEASYEREGMTASEIVAEALHESGTSLSSDSVTDIWQKSKRAGRTSFPPLQSIMWDMYPPKIPDKTEEDFETRNEWNSHKRLELERSWRLHREIDDMNEFRRNLRDEWAIAAIAKANVEG